MTTIARLARQRPATTLVVGGVGLTVSTLWGVEVYANRQERLATEYAGNKRGNGSSTSWTVQLPREYHREEIREYWIRRPISIVSRFGQIVSELVPVASSYAYDFYLFPDNDKNPQRLAHHARRFREALTNLGPAWIKGGQQLAIRPDLVPPIVLKELQLLCDAVRPIPDSVALELIQRELQITSLEDTFVDGQLELVAAASLGQVYQGRLVDSGHLVAVKVQRPGMRQSFSLDLFLLQGIADSLDRFNTTFTKQAPYHRALIDSFSKGSYSELDYQNEARNQILFQEELTSRGCPVKIPHVYEQHTSEQVLTTEWIEGVKLADSSKETIRKLIPVGVELFLTQLLDIGTFHADPHPGNLLVTTPDENGNGGGVLCLLDFGLCAEVDPSAREAMSKALVHLLYRDFDSLVHSDSKELGFLPYDFDTTELKPILTKVLMGGLLESGSDLRNRKRKLQEISNELNEIFFEYPFQVPPFFALITRGLGLLEGIALTGDPEFDIFRASVPYASRMAVTLLGRQVTARRRSTTDRASNFWKRWWYGMPSSAVE